MPTRGLQTIRSRIFTQPDHQFGVDRPVRAARLGLIALLVLAGQVAGQTHRLYNPVTTVDRYGNAQPFYNERRFVGLYQNQIQEYILRSYQEAARRMNQRGDINPFSLPNGLTRNRFTSLPMDQFLRLRGFTRSTVRSDAAKERSYRQYGGFGKREKSAEPGDLATALQRQGALLSATEFNAPIHRALAGGSGRSAVWPGAGELMPDTTKTTSTLDREVSLVERLRETDVADHRSASDYGWRSFREGQYQQAADFFETAYDLDGQDFRARIGEMFSDLSLGFFRSARIDFRSLIVAEPDPFIHDFNVLPFFGDKRDALRVRMQMQALANVKDAHPDFRALYALVLWYLGQRQETITVLDELARERPDSDYASWPVKANQARKKFPPREDRATP